MCRGRGEGGGQLQNVLPLAILKGEGAGGGWRGSLWYGHMYFQKILYPSLEILRISHVHIHFNTNFPVTLTVSRAADLRVDFVC